MKNLKRAISVLLLFLPVLLLALSNEAAAMTYSVLAVVPKHGHQFHGYDSANSLQQARRKALDKCASGKCIVVRQYKTPQCVHIVLGTQQIFWNDRRTDIGELANVLAYCRQVDKNCRVLVHKCL